MNGPVQHDLPATTGVKTGGGRTRLLVVIAAVALIAVVLLVIWAASRGAEGGARLDRSSPEAVATVFAQRYAAHDPAACELAVTPVRATLDRQGGCGGQVPGTAPRVTVLFSVTCGSKHGYAAQVDPPGQIGAPYLSVGLTRFGQDWLVDDMQPVSDRSVLRSYSCDTN